MLGKKRSKLTAEGTNHPERRRPFIDVMSEIGAGPIWLCENNDDIRQPVPPRSLPISKTLAKEFELWQAERDKPLLNKNQDWHKIPALPADYEERGRVLTNRLIAEIGDTYDIKYDY